jgi:hypothetical protein
MSVRQTQFIDWSRNFRKHCPIGVFGVCPISIILEQIIQGVPASCIENTKQRRRCQCGFKDSPDDFSPSSSFSSWNQGYGMQERNKKWLFFNFMSDVSGCPAQNDIY